MAIDAKQIAHLAAIAEYGSFTRAAAAQSMSQPALSNSIALLERRLGVKVLNRSRSGATLNEYGEILVRRAGGLQGLLAQAEQEVELRRIHMEGSLSIGATPSVLPQLLPQALNILTTTGGRMEVSISEGAHEQLLSLLRSGQLDVIVGSVFGRTANTDDVIEEFLVDDPYCIAVGCRSEFTNREGLRLKDLINAPWVLPRQGTVYSRQIEAIFLNSNLPWPQDCFISNSLPLVREIVCISNRVSIVSRMQLIGAGDERLRGIALDNNASRPLGFKVMRDVKLSPLAERFIIALRQAALRLSEQVQQVVCANVHPS